MAVHGYVTHAAHNRRFTAMLVAAYLIAFQLIAMFALTWFLLMFDEEHTILSNPAGYAMRYALPVALVSGFQFWWLYRGHADTVRRWLEIRPVTRAQEYRFVAIAEEACTAMGVRFPRFGIIEAPQPNALTVGEGPDHGLIAVTRGLLDLLDDEELAAVLTHEAAHIRHGDTKVLAANHALMRTAVILQTHNILRIEDWRQMIIPLLMPPTLLLFLCSGMVTMFSMRLARYARRGLKLSRDHVADGEAIRITHFPEALVSALNRIGGQGGFPRSERVESMLFDGRADHEGGSHPMVKDRIDAITMLGAQLMQPGRSRRDTRTPPGGMGSLRPASGFGRRGLATGQAPAFAHMPNRQLAYAAAQMPEPPGSTVPEKPSLAMMMLFFTDRDRFWNWQNASIDSMEWRENDDRNMFGFKPQMLIPVAATTAFLLTLHWPADGDFSKLRDKMGPMALVDMARKINGGPFCHGTGYPDGKCPER